MALGLHLCEQNGEGGTGFLVLDGRWEQTSCGIYL